jgi:hypothetical protein
LALQGAAGSERHEIATWSPATALGDWFSTVAGPTSRCVLERMFGN